MTRQQFLWKLGNGTVAIAGYFLLPRSGLAEVAPDAERSDEAEPWLRGDIVMRSDADGLVLTLPSAATSPVCAVNAAGTEVVRRLDGRTSVPAIARVLAHHAHTDAIGQVEVKVACFVAQLGQMGFLRAPFYAMITERYES